MFIIVFFSDLMKGVKTRAEKDFFYIYYFFICLLLFMWTACGWNTEVYSVKPHTKRDTKARRFIQLLNVSLETNGVKGEMDHHLIFNSVPRKTCVRQP